MCAQKHVCTTFGHVRASIPNHRRRQRRLNTVADRHQTNSFLFCEQWINFFFGKCAYVENALSRCCWGEKKSRIAYADRDSSKLCRVMIWINSCLFFLGCGLKKQTRDWTIQTTHAPPARSKYYFIYSISAAKRKMFCCRLFDVACF